MEKIVLNASTNDIKLHHYLLKTINLKNVNSRKMRHRKGMVKGEINRERIYKTNKIGMINKDRTETILKEECSAD